MIPALEPFRPQIEALCRKHRVARLDVFGSALQASSLDECGDVDLLVRFTPDAPADRADAYFGLWADMEHLLGKPVDLLEGKAVRNPYLRYAIHESRRNLYAA
jgi:predicted nucleotidyltransferase